ncbi:hypothetical protein QOL99_09625, partial [Deinococcus sp. MIMF12]
ALAGQSRAARSLEGYAPAPVFLAVVNGVRRTSLTLGAADAACVERALRLGVRSELRTTGQPILLTAETRVEGALPPRETVEALTLRGLACPNVRSVTDTE